MSLIIHFDFPSLLISRLIISSLSKLTLYFPRISITGCLLLISKTAVTEASVSLFLIRLKSTLLPKINPILSSKIDFPAPVSPVKTDKPCLK